MPPNAPAISIVPANEASRQGWCAVEPRTAYEGLVRNNRVPWVDRVGPGPSRATP